MLDADTKKKYHVMVRDHLICGILTRHAHRPGVIESLMSEFKEMMKDHSDETGKLEKRPHYLAHVIIVHINTIK